MAKRATVSSPNGKVESSSTIKAVEVHAELRQIKTMVDSTINVTLNLPEDCLEQAKILLGWQGEEIRIIIARSEQDE